MANSNEKIAYDFFRARGYSDVAARGIVGNLSHESGGLNTKAINRGDGNDGSDSIGIAQWNGTRAKNLKSYAQARGMSANSLEAQLSFVDYELRTSERKTFSKLTRATSVKDAVGAFLGYERPKGYNDTDPSGSMGYADRLSRARNSQLGSGGLLQLASSSGIDLFIANNPGTTYSMLPNGSYAVRGPDGEVTEYLPGAFDHLRPEVGTGGGAGSGGLNASGSGSGMSPSKDVPEAIDQSTAIGSQTDVAIAEAEAAQASGFFEGWLGFGTDLFGRAAIIALGLIVLAAGLVWFSLNTRTGRQLKAGAIKVATRGVV